MLGLIFDHVTDHKKGINYSEDDFEHVNKNSSPDSGASMFVCRCGTAIVAQKAFALLETHTWSRGARGAVLTDKMSRTLTTFPKKVIFKW